MNEWLNPVVEAYNKRHRHFSNTRYVWDVGSRDGKDGVELAERIGGSESDVVAVEANPEQAKIIRESYPQARVLQTAVGNVRGEVSFTVYEGDEGVVGSSSLNDKWKDPESHDSHNITTPIVPLADLVGDEEIAILKLDCEGFSYDVLIGLGQKIKQVRVLHIETETWTASDKAVEAYMDLMGFDIFDVREQYSGMPDYTFVRRDLEI